MLELELQQEEEDMEFSWLRYQGKELTNKDDGIDVAELLTPPRVAARARQRSLRGGLVNG